MAKVSDKILRRIYLMFAGVLLFSLLIVLQILKIQWIEGERWIEKQDKERVYFKNIPAMRGSILAANGEVFATTLPFYRIALDASVLRESNFPNFQDSLSMLCNKLARYFGDEQFNAQYFKNKILEAKKRKDKHIYLFPVGKTFKYQEMKLLKSFPIFNHPNKNISGLIIEKINNKRFYPYEELAKSTLGILKDDTLGVRGLEHAYNRELRGTDGLMLVQRIAGGTEIPLSDFEMQEPKDGYDIKTTIQVELQDVVHTALEKGVLENEAQGGVAILMEVNTGKIIAIANYPEHYNHAIGTPLEPGSTFKIATLMAFLEDRAIGLNDTINTYQGQKDLYGLKMKDEAAYSKLTLKQAFEKSSNIAFAEVSENFYSDKPQKFIDRLYQIGILKHTGSQIKGEPEPYIIKPNHRLWSKSSLPWLSIGYNVKLTPLQILTFVNGIANNGKLISPILVSQVRDGSNIIEEFESQIITPKMCSKSTLRTVQEFMLGVVENGTAKGIKDTVFKIAGKTGTVQKFMDGKYQKKYRSSFVGYFPADNPKYSCYVMIDEPEKGEYYGSRVAAPVFKEIADYIYYRDLEIQQNRIKTNKFAASQLPYNRITHKEDIIKLYQLLDIPIPNDLPLETEYIKTHNKGKFVAMDNINFSGKYVPNVKGMTAKDAVPLLENMGFWVRLHGSGKVKYQSISPGEPIHHDPRKKQLISLTLE